MTRTGSGGCVADVGQSARGRTGLSAAPRAEAGSGAGCAGPPWRCRCRGSCGPSCRWRSGSSAPCCSSPGPSTCGRPFWRTGRSARGRGGGGGTRSFGLTCLLPPGLGAARAARPRGGSRVLQPRLVAPTPATAPRGLDLEALRSPLETALRCRERRSPARLPGTPHRCQVAFLKIQMRVMSHDSGVWLPTAHQPPFSSLGLAGVLVCIDVVHMLLIQRLRALKTVSS